jgi:tetratricopeptide (TPR) repeat protein
LIQAVKLEPHNNPWERTLGLALAQQGLLYFRKGELVRSQELYRESLDILRPIGDPTLLTDALVLWGVLTHLNGDYGQSKSLLQEGLACALASNDHWFAAYAIYNLGYVDSLMGDYHRGYEQMMRGLETWRSLGDPHSIALGLNYLVSTLIKLECFEEAKAFMYESIALCEQTKNRWGMGTAYRCLGLATLAEGKYAEAQAHFRKSLEIFGAYIEGWDIARSLTYLGDAVFMMGDLPEAESAYREALRLAIEAKSIPVALDAVVGLARLQLCHGEVEKAFALASYVLNQAASTQDSKEISRRLVFETERHLNDRRVRSIREGITNQSLGAMIETLLKEV